MIVVCVLFNGLRVNHLGIGLSWDRFFFGAQKHGVVLEINESSKESSQLFMDSSEDRKSEMGSDSEVEEEESNMGFDSEVEEEESNMGFDSEVEEESDMGSDSEVEEEESDTGSDSHWKHELAVASPLFKAIFEENTKGIKDFLSVEGIKININCGTIDGDPLNINDALYWACFYGHVQSVKALLANGADPEKEPIHFTVDGPIIHAACFGGLEVLKPIMDWMVWKYRKDPSLFKLDSFLNAIDKDSKSTALHVATSLENLEVVQYLLQQGANPCIPDLCKKYPYEHARAGTLLFFILKEAYEKQVDTRYQQEQLIKMRRRIKMRKSQKNREGMIKIQKTPGGMEASAPAAGSPNPPAS